MNLLHIVFYLAMGAGWHQVRNDLHRTSEMGQETRTAIAGAELAKWIH